MAAFVIVACFVLSGLTAIPIPKMISWMIQCYHLSSSHRRSGTDQLITLPFLSCGFWLFVCLVCFWFWFVCFVVCFVSVFSVGIVTAYWTMYWSYFSSTFAVSITLHVCA